jgi:hypothetical protein
MTEDQKTNQDGQIIIVSGLPRSGTSMMMKMLDAGGFPLLTDNIRAADEHNPKGYYELEPVKQLDTSSDKKWLEQACDKAIKVVSPLLGHLPDKYRYRVLFMQRNLWEILASQKKMLNSRAPDQVDRISDEELLRNYVRHLEKIKTFFEENRNFEVLFFGYRQVLNSPLEQAQRIKEFLGVELDLTAMAQIIDKNLYRNRRNND